MIKARIHRVDNREFLCKNLDTGEKIVVGAKGTVHKSGGMVVGDYVFLEQQGDAYRVLRREPRHNEIYRILQREGKKKISASNVDYLVIVCSVSKPPYKRGFIDRYLVRAEQWEIPPLVIFNKMDSYGGEDFDLPFELHRLSYRNIPYFLISSKGREFPSPVPRELYGDESQLKEILSRKVALFIGQSGVGKSTCISALSGGMFNLKNNRVGKSGKGKHTTTWSEILEIGSLTLIDSPGIRSFSLDDIREEELLTFFPVLREMATQCEFSNCTHEVTSHGCFFYQSGVFRDEREEKIILSYLETYRRLFAEISQIPSWRK